jgi:hypothetical protein
MLGSLVFGVTILGAFPGVLLGATAGVPVAVACDRPRLGWVVAAIAGVLGGGWTAWVLAGMSGMHFG